MFMFRGSPQKYKAMAAQSKHEIHKFRQMACLSRVPMLLGSLLEKARKPKKYYNTSLLISHEGKEIARYRKIHLFDVSTPNHQKIHESKDFLPGKQTVTASLLGTCFGLSVCYDLRFPEMFRQLVRKGAEVIFVPANFLHETGKAHWHTLLRARAIENQVYIVAPAQVGTHPATKQKSYGHSLIIDPWGSILAEGSGGVAEVISASLNFDALRRLRKQFPVLKSV